MQHVTQVTRVRDKMLCKFPTKQYCYNVQLYAIQAVSLKRHRGAGTTWDG